MTERPSPKPLLFDHLDPIEERCKAHLAAEPTPPADEFDRLCWDAMHRYVTTLYNVRTYGRIDKPSEHDSAANPAKAGSRA